MAEGEGDYESDEGMRLDMDEETASSSPPSGVEEGEPGKCEKRGMTYLEMAKKGGITYCGIPSCGMKCDKWTFAEANALAYFGFKDRFAIVKICTACKEKAEQFEQNSMEAVRNFGNMFTVKYEPQTALPEMVNLDADEMTDSHLGASRRSDEDVEVDFDRCDVDTLVKDIMAKYNVQEQVEKCKQKCTDEATALGLEMQELFEDMEKVDSILYSAYKKYNNVFNPRLRPYVTEEVEVNADGSVRRRPIVDDLVVNTESLNKLPELLKKLSADKASKAASAEDQVEADPNQSINSQDSRKPGPASKTGYYEALDAKRGPFDVQVSLPAELCERKASKLLPTPSFIPRVQPKEGDIVYVVFKNLLQLWVKGEVIEVIDNPITKQKEFIVHYEPTRNGRPTGGIEADDTRRLIRQLSLRQMAYNLPCPFLLPVGSRVIAKYKDTDPESDGYYFAGIVAEPPKKSSKNRYLIFFDDGYAQYVYPMDVLLVCESSKYVWNDVYPNSYDFVKEYITKWPQWPMVKLHVGSMITTEWNGKWSITRVLEIDNCLARVRFECDGREEWIYRGSTRFRPIFRVLERQEEDKKQQQESNSKENRVPRHDSEEHKNRKGPLVEYKNEDVNSMEVYQKGALKSTTSRLHYYDELQEVMGKTPSLINMLDPDLCIEFQGSVSKIKIPADAPKPKDFVPHTCGASCVLPFVPSKELKRLSPLAIPFFFGWAREVIRVSRRAVFYRAPCGLRLRDGDELAQFLDVSESNLSIDHFCFDYDVDCLNEFVPARALVNLKDISYGKENVPIQCVNSVDYDSLPYMEYSPERVIGTDVPLNTDTDFMVCCDCTDNCQDKSKCACWKLTQQGISFSEKMAANNPDLIPKGYDHRRLETSLVSGIYECNSKCKCKQTCCNRVVQNGVQWPLQIFKTAKKGWGIRSLYDMPQGTFICIYSGVILTEQSANVDGNEKGDEYLAELDFIECNENVKAGYESDVTDIEDESSSEDDEHEDDDDDSKTEDGGKQTDKVGGGFKRKFAVRKTGGQSRVREEQDENDDDDDDDDKFDIIDDDDDFITARKPCFNPKVGSSRKRRKHRHRNLYVNGKEIYVMDARDKGNIGRYMNHSCNPNVFVQNVFVDTQDLRFPLVSFFTGRFIKAGTELTWDYNYQIGSVPNKTLYCYCMTPYCRGRLL